MVTATQAAWAAAAAVVDPEIRVITLEELGVLRDVEVTGDGAVMVTITPTYIGCPAMDVIRSDLAAAIRAAGHDQVVVRTVFRPSWTTDMISPGGREKLRAAGIAPPAHVGAVATGVRAPDGARHLTILSDNPVQPPPCPRCGSADTEEISHFGSTACKSLWRCDRCREPFDHIKAL